MQFKSSLTNQSRPNGYSGSAWDPDDPVGSLPYMGWDKYTRFRDMGVNQMKKVNLMETSRWNNEEDDFDASSFEETENYSNWQLEKIADDLLRKDSNRETCRTCQKYGDETGEIESQPVIESKTGNYVTDKEGNTLYADVPEIMCKNGHRWYKGEGKRRGIDGDNSILFENHLRDRHRREIQTSIGTPDPSIARGMYNRTHPQGRKVNSKEQRKRNGASFFR